MQNDHQLDPITREVIRHKLEGIAEEMEITLIHSAFSTIVKEGLDASASIFSDAAEVLCQSVASPTHLGVLQPTVRAFLRKVGPRGFKDGDIYVTNDPADGNSHLPDFALLAPIFYQGIHVATAAVMTHHQDVGGMAPGSTPTNAINIHQEGLRVPMMKIVSEGVVREDVVDLFKMNSRVPDLFAGDLLAQIAACEICRRRMTELAGRYEAAILKIYFDSLLDHSERMIRRAIREIPDGIYENVDYLDNDGVNLDERIKVRTRIEIKGDSIEFDFTGSHRELRGPFNVVPSGVYAAACFALKAFTDGEGVIPINGGCFRPIKLTVPPNSMLNPGPDAAIGCRSTTIKRVASSMLAALRRAAPGRVPADHASVELLIHFGGHLKDGRKFVTSQVLVGGSGAAEGRDGVDAIETDTTNCMSIPVEAFEMDGPIRVNRFALRTGSGGPGRWRGGLGLDAEYEFLADDITVTFRGERHFTQPAGLDGGGSGQYSVAYILRASGEKEFIPSKIVAVLNKGDRLMVGTAGGGGFGDPQSRPVDLVREDIFNRKIAAAV